MNKIQILDADQHRQNIRSRMVAALIASGLPLVPDIFKDKKLFEKLMDRAEVLTERIINADL